ncbi:MAG: hypothetical protein JWN50_621 [Parcubacteria group bacterium]|nr:hypothetical protein [Parcubacteria group bacterium]
MNAVASGIRITSHAVGIVQIDDSASDGSVLVGRMDYARKGRKSVRHVMETGEPGESVMDTFRSSLHEAAADQTKFNHEFVTDEPIFCEFGIDEKNEGGTHLKVWFAIRPQGKLRDYVLPDGDETLGPITMVEAIELLKETEGNTVRGHVSATYAALSALAGDRKVFDRYQKQILSWTQPVLTEEQLAAINVYPGKW